MSGDQKLKKKKKKDRKGEIKRMKPILDKKKNKWNKIPTEKIEKKIK